MIAYGWLINWYQRQWNTIEATDIIENELVTTISLIIPARNEELQMDRLIKALLAQTYPKNLLEIVIIDDHSSDQTLGIAKKYAAENSHIKVIALKDHLDGNQSMAFKKKAIATGIDQSNGELIVTTDADCTFDRDWLKSIASFYNQKKAAFIAAPVRINGGNSILSKFQAIDFLTLQGITGAAVKRKFHSMCNGANLAYTRESYNAVNGFEGIDHLPSGDDMLLMHKIYLRFPERVYYLKAMSAIVDTEPQPTWRSFFQQRIRWASKSTNYQDKRIFWVLLLVYLLNLFFLGAVIGSFFNSKLAFFTMLFLIAKILIEFPFINNIASFFNMRPLLTYHILLQPLHIFYTVVAGWLGKFGSFEWKGRQIKK